MSAKEIVLVRYPYAYAYQWAGPKPWVIYATRPGDPGHAGQHLSAACATAAEAWESAASQLQPSEASGNG